VSPDAKDLITKLLEPDPEKRLSAKSMLKVSGYCRACSR
jgi:serine/threonine protein kinase